MDHNIDESIEKLTRQNVDDVIETLTNHNVDEVIEMLTKMVELHTLVGSPMYVVEILANHECIEAYLDHHDRASKFNEETKEFILNNKDTWRFAWEYFYGSVGWDW